MEVYSAVKKLKTILPSPSPYWSAQAPYNHIQIMCFGDQYHKK